MHGNKYKIVLGENEMVIIGETEKVMIHSTSMTGKLNEKLEEAIIPKRGSVIISINNNGKEEPNEQLLGRYSRLSIIGILRESTVIKKPYSYVYFCGFKYLGNGDHYSINLEYRNIDDLVFVDAIFGKMRDIVGIDKLEKYFSNR